MKKILWISYKLSISLMLICCSFIWIEHFVISLRGYYAVGGEAIIAIMIGVGSYVGLEKLLGENRKKYETKKTETEITQGKTNRK